MDINLYKYNKNFLAFIALNTTGANIYPPQDMYKPIKDKDILFQLRKLVSNNFFRNNYIGLYFHIPFCYTKCLFCNCGSKVLNNQKEMEEYVNNIIKTSSTYKDLLGNNKITSLYFGGGTPSILSEKLLDKFLGHIFKSYNFSKNVQWNFEVHPSTLTRSKLEILKKYGINRLTIGIQSLDNYVLRKNNRYGKVEDIEKVFEIMKKIGYKPIVNIDFMVGLLGQKINEIKAIYEFVKKHNIDILHIYPFRPSLDTLFYKLGYKFSDIDYKKRDYMFNLLEKLFLKLGYQYIKHDSLAIRKDAYNKQEYEKEEYNSTIIAYGKPVRGYLFNLLSYFNGWDNKYYGFYLKDDDAARRYAFSHINSGIDIDNFRSIFGTYFNDLFKMELDFISGNVNLSSNKLFFTFKYVREKLMFRWLFASDEIFVFLINKFKNKYNSRIDYIKELKSFIGKYYN